MGLNDLLGKTNEAISKAFNKHNKKTDSKDAFFNIAGMLDSHEMEIFVVRDKGCKLLYTNERATERIGAEKPGNITCNRIFGKQFPNLCDYCPNLGEAKNADGVPFEIHDVNGNYFSVKRNTIIWDNGKPATVFIMHDITREKDANEKLYTLAYIDQLTGVPNRQKLKDDFAAITAKITNNELSGIIALFDLDNFKEINDTYGHNTGDVVLRRLTDHLQDNDDFKDTIYRLGGDEFIIFMTTPSDRFPTFPKLQQHYSNILSGALQAYTLPNIELKCTLSIGVAFFPKHGNTLSELLSKADIALYQAKAAGRNQVLFFESKYQKVKKFKDIYIDIQPILLGSGKTFGYELLDRGQGREEEEGTVALSEFNHTLDALGLNDIENNLHYFITYTKQLLNPAVLRNLPREKFIVQINLPDSPSKATINNDIKIYNELREKDYRLALTGLNSASPVVELMAIVDYCKFSPSDTNVAKQKLIISRNQRIRFIATGINTIQDYQSAKDAGFHMFQGFYFNNPILERKTKEVSPLKVNYYRLLQLSNTEDYMDFKEICSVISSDVALSYKLLNLLNSAAVGLKHVSSISAAVAYMGEQSIKKWIAVLALRGIAEDKPLEIVRMSLIRARFGELLAPCFRATRNAQHVFMVGMLSLLHIAMDMSKEDLINDIPVSDEISSSLLTRNGPHSDLLQFYENYEYANWDAVSQFVEENQLDPNMVSDSYIAAVKWYSDLSSG